MKIVNTSFIFCFLFAHSIHASQSIYANETLISQQNVTQRLAKAAIATVAMYGSYKLVDWLMEPENRSYRALENAKGEIIETEALLVSLGIDTKNLKELDQDIYVIASRAQALYPQIHLNVDKHSAEGHLYRMSTHRSIRRAILDIELCSLAIEIRLLQIDYCLKNYASSYNAELEEVKIKLLEYKQLLNDQIIPGLKKHMHGLLINLGYRINSVIAKFCNDYISKPLHPIF